MINNSLLIVKNKIKNINKEVLYINSSNILAIIKILICLFLNFFNFIIIYSESKIKINKTIIINLIIL